MMASRVQIINAIADGKAEAGTPSLPQPVRQKFANCILVL
jgi:hypothetical protein